MEIVETFAEVLSQYLPLISEKNHEISHGPVGVTAKTRAMNLLNTNQGVRLSGGESFVSIFGMGVSFTRS